MRKHLAWIVPLSLIAFGVLSASDTPSVRKATPVDVLMRSKMASSQKVMEGLVARDFGLVQKGAQEILKVCDAAEWRSSEDHVYAHFKTELRRQAQKLETFGEQQNLDGTTFAYLNLISNCVDCHSHCRDVLRIAAELPDLKPVPDPDRGSSSENRRPVRR